MKKVLVILVLLLNCYFGFGQVTLETPIITIVSVNPSSSDVTIKWEMVTDTNIKGFVICEFVPDPSAPNNIGFNSEIDTVWGENQTSLTFPYPDVTTRPVYFSVYSIDSIGDRSARSDPAHRTIHLETKFDSCNMALNLTWSKYIGWDNNISLYRIFVYVNASSSFVNVAASDTSYDLTGITPDASYFVYVVAINSLNNTLNSLSNGTSIYTHVATLPSSIFAQSANYSGTTVDLTFQLDPTAEVRNYRLLRSSQSGGPFTPIDSFMNLTSPSLAYSDSPGGDATTYYRLEALNACGNSSGIQSNLATAIVPKYTLSAQQVNLSWDNYLNWGPGVQEYRINRSVSGQPFNYVSSTSGTTPNYTDNLGALVGQQLSGNVCYYIESVAAGSTSYTSRSQTICIDLTSDIFVPNAFTPNGDGVNDEFLPSFAFLPDKFYMSIYNRFGTKIFETDDPSRGWKGITSAGQRAPEGVYIYLITYYSASGVKKQKNGSFSLIYP